MLYTEMHTVSPLVAYILFSVREYKFQKHQTQLYYNDCGQFDYLKFCKFFIRTLCSQRWKFCGKAKTTHGPPDNSQSKYIFCPLLWSILSVQLMFGKKIKYALNSISDFSKFQQNKLNFSVVNLSVSTAKEISQLYEFCH